MLKRTKGLLLLTSLVITGLAGTLSDTSLSSKERKFAVTQFKDTKTDLLKSVKDLSDAQLDFRASAERWSIKECVYHITMTEQALWGMFEATMKQPANPEKRAEIKVTDEELTRMLTDRSKKLTAPEQLRPAKAPWKSLSEAMTAFKENRNNILKYTRTTTEDLRNHVFQLSFGHIDGYQFLLFMAAHSNRHTQQLNEVKEAANFPKN